MILMFLVGLLLGAAPSAYFWDLSKKADRMSEDARAKIMEDQRALEDSMTVLHGSFNQLAMGQTKNIPDMERSIRQIRAESAEKRSTIDREYARNREKLLKKTPAGDRLDKALAQLDQQRKQRLQELTSQETAAVEPLDKQIKILKDLASR